MKVPDLLPALLEPRYRGNLRAPRVKKDSWGRTNATDVGNVVRQSKCGSTHAGDETEQKKVLCKTLVKSPSVAKRRRVRKQRRNCSVTGVSTEKRASRQPKRKQCVRSVVLCRVEIRQPMGSAPLATMRSVQRRATLSDAS